MGDVDVHAELWRKAEEAAPVLGYPVDYIYRSLVHVLNGESPSRVKRLRWYEWLWWQVERWRNR
jgi:hypothetical protein